MVAYSCWCCLAYWQAMALYESNGMKNATSDLPPSLQAFASLLDAQPPDVQEAFQFLPATAMHEAGKFELLNVAEVDDRWHYTLPGAAVLAWRRMMRRPNVQ